MRVQGRRLGLGPTQFTKFVDVGPRPNLPLPPMEREYYVI